MTIYANFASQRGLVPTPGVACMRHASVLLASND
jgi:hypothetical protein